MNRFKKETDFNNIKKKIENKKENDSSQCLYNNYNSFASELKKNNALNSKLVNFTLLEKNQNCLEMKIKNRSFSRPISPKGKKKLMKQMISNSFQGGVLNTNTNINTNANKTNFIAKVKNPDSKIPNAKSSNTNTSNENTPKLNNPYETEILQTLPNDYSSCLIETEGKNTYNQSFHDDTIGNKYINKANLLIKNTSSLNSLNNLNSIIKNKTDTKNNANLSFNTSQNQISTSTYNNKLNIYNQINKNFNNNTNSNGNKLIPNFINNRKNSNANSIVMQRTDLFKNLNNSNSNFANPVDQNKNKNNSYNNSNNFNNTNNNFNNKLKSTDNPNTNPNINTNTNNHTDTLTGNSNTIMNTKYLLEKHYTIERLKKKLAEVNTSATITTTKASKNELQNSKDSKEKPPTVININHNINHSINHNYHILLNPSHNHNARSNSISPLETTLSKCSNLSEASNCVNNKNKSFANNTSLNSPNDPLQKPSAYLKKKLKSKIKGFDIINSGNLSFSKIKDLKKKNAGNINNKEVFQTESNENKLEKDLEAKFKDCKNYKNSKDCNNSNNYKDNKNSKSPYDYKDSEYDNNINSNLMIGLIKNNKKVGSGNSISEDFFINKNNNLVDKKISTNLKKKQSDSGSLLSEESIFDAFYQKHKNSKSKDKLSKNNGTNSSSMKQLSLSLKISTESNEKKSFSKEKSNSTNKELLEATLSYTLSDDENNTKKSKREAAMILPPSKNNSSIDLDDFKKFYEEMNLKFLNYK